MRQVSLPDCVLGERAAVHMLPALPFDLLINYMLTSYAFWEYFIIDENSIDNRIPGVSNLSIEARDNDMFFNN